MARQVMEILDKHLNKVNEKFKTLEDFTLEENDNIHKELEAQRHAKYEMKEIITSLEGWLMDALRTIKAMKVEIETLKGGLEDVGFVTPNDK